MFFQINNILILTVFSAFLLSSCLPGGRQSEVPAHLIDQENMTKILAEVHVLEAWLNRLPNDTENIPELREYAYSEMLSKYNTNTETFNKSLEFYLNNSHLLHEIYPDIIETLSEREGLSRDAEK
jgi:hypothetical protein